MQPEFSLQLDILKRLKPSWHKIEAREVVGGANVSHIITLTPLELYPDAAMMDPLEVT